MAILNIPITKAGKSIPVDTNDFDENVYAEIFAAGLKVFLNARQSKVTVKDLEGEALAAAQAAALEIAEKNLTELRSGKVRKGRAASASKIPGVVLTEARRLAKEVIKNEIRAAGFKVSHVEASEITKLANELIASDPSYIAQAEANIATRTAVVETDQAAAMAKLNALGGVKLSEKKIAADEKAKAERKSQLSAKQAGKVAPRKPKAAEVTAH